MPQAKSNLERLRARERPRKRMSRSQRSASRLHQTMPSLYRVRSEDDALRHLGRRRSFSSRSTLTARIGRRTLCRPMLKNDTASWEEVHPVKLEKLSQSCQMFQTTCALWVPLVTRRKVLRCEGAERPPCFTQYIPCATTAGSAAPDLQKS